MACRTNAWLTVVSALSIVTGVAVTYGAIHMHPKPDMARYMRMSALALQKEVGWPHGNILSTHPAWEYYESRFWVLVGVFKDLFHSTFGKGAFMLIMSIMSPISGFTMVEAMKPTQHVLLGGLSVMLIFFAGQAICIGAALPIFYVPAYAAVRALRPGVVHPLPAFSASGLQLLEVLMVLVALPALLSGLIPTSHSLWVPVNIWFQVFPIVLVLVSIYGLVAPQNPPVSPTALAAVYRRGRITSSIVYYTSLILMAPTLWEHAHGRDLIMNDAIKLILMDAAGVLLTLVFVVVIDAITDPVPAGSVRVNAHAKNYQGWVVGTVGAMVKSVLLGPGNVMNEYLAEREEAVAPVHAVVILEEKKSL
ncbi:hypothetical protein MSPP1_002330 [Malassezia sp. CBS 17886]|nr:hypothetical protein MSPP1_002330 [Malassezia sp. CBS 17886]